MKTIHALVKNGAHASDTHNIFEEPIVAPRWLARGLQIGPGRPTMICGYSFSGKTLFALSLLLAVITGRPLFGRFSVREGRALYLDYESGVGSTKVRLRRLFSTLNHPEKIEEGKVALASFPERFIDSENAEVWLTAACRGFDLVVIDSLRQATPSSDENSSEIGTVLAALARVSVATGAAIVLVHHAGKPKDYDRDKRMLPRGSSAIFSQCGCVLMLARGNDGTIEVSQARSPTEAYDPPVASFELVVIEAPGKQIEVLAADGTPAAIGGLEMRLAEGLDRLSAESMAILLAIRDHRFRSATALTTHIRRNKQGTLDEIRRLKARGLLMDSQALELNERGHAALATGFAT